MAPIIHRPALPIPLPLARGGLAATTAAGGRSTLGLGAAALEDYLEGSFTLTATGMTTSVTGTANFVKVGALFVLAIPTLTGMSNSTTLTLTGVPTIYDSVLNSVFPVWLTDSFVAFLGVANMAIGGTMLIYRDIGGTPFTASSGKGIYNATFTYVVA